MRFSTSSGANAATALVAALAAASISGVSAQAEAATTTAAAAGTVATAGAITTITRQGRYLVNPAGGRFIIKGIAYQPAGAQAAQTAENDANGGFPEPSSYVDPLVNVAACNRDIPNLQRLGVNTIRVYNVNGFADHSACMNAFNTAGIYVIADLALPQNGSINRASPSWDTSLLNEYIQTIENLAPYKNLLAVNVANEVVTSANNTVASAFIKAAARDIKAYLKSKSYTFLVGYSSADGDPWRTELANYLTCGTAETSIDIFGLNSYSGCGATSITPYNNLNTAFATFPVPAYFSEFGCLQAGTRTWSEVAVIFGTQMLNIWSGGMAFEYFADTQGLGLTANTTSVDGPITTNADFTRLATQYNAATLPTTLPAGASTAAVPTCATDTNQLSSANLPPTPQQSICNCLNQNAFSCIINPNATPATVGSLINQACSLLGGAGGSCNPIASDGTTGTYGPYSYCSPQTKLNYVMSEYFQSQNRVATACSFGGNATVNAAAPSGSAAASASASACLAGQSVGAVVPTAAGTTKPTSSGGAAAAGSSSGTAKSGATSLSLGGGNGVALGLVAALVAAAAGAATVFSI